MTSSSTFKSASGEGYELLMGRWSRRLAEPFLDFAGVKDGEYILDAGSGTGSLAFAIARRNKTVTIHGADLSDAYIAHAKAHNTDPRITFQKGDLCALPYADRAFDRVLSLLVLHFVPQTEKAIAELRRVARLGATVAATVWDARGGFVANRIFYDTAAALDPAANTARASKFTAPMSRPGELAAAWRRAGFTEVADTTLAVRMEFDSFQDYWGPFVGKDGPAAQYVASLAADTRDALREAVRAAYLDGEPDGPRSYAAVAWAVKGIAP